MGNHATRVPGDVSPRMDTLLSPVLATVMARAQGPQGDRECSCLDTLPLSTRSLAQERLCAVLGSETTRISERSVYPNQLWELERLSAGPFPGKIQELE